MEGTGLPELALLKDTSELGTDYSMFSSTLLVPKFEARWCFAESIGRDIRLSLALELPWF